MKKLISAILYSILIISSYSYSEVIREKIYLSKHNKFKNDDETCTGSQVYDEKFKKCFDVNSVTIPVQPAQAPQAAQYFQSNVKAEANTMNIFTLNVIQDQNSIPGVLYISDNQTGATFDLQSESIGVYMATGCNSQCNVAPADASYSSNCNDLFVKEESSVITSYQTKEATDCSIVVVITVTDPIPTSTLMISLIPIYVFDAQTKLSDSQAINSFWKSPDHAQRIIQINFDKESMDLTNVKYIRTKLVGIDEAAINGMTFGTDYTKSSCFTKFPTGTTCSTENTKDYDGTYTYYSEALTSSSKIYLFLDIFKSLTFKFFYNYYCNVNYAYSYELEKCVPFKSYSLTGASKYSKTLLQYYYQYSATAKNGYITFYTFQVDQFTAESSSPIPGTFYILDKSTDSAALTNENIKIHLSTSCSTADLDYTSQPNLMYNWDQLFNHKFPSVWTASLNKVNEECKVSIALQVISDYGKDYNFQMKILPMYSLYATHYSSGSSSPMPFGVEWKSPDNAYRIYKFYIDSKIITDNIQSINLQLKNIPTNLIKDISFGTDNSEDSCTNIFPNDNACKPELIRQDITSDYNLKVKANTKLIYPFIEIKANQTTYLEFQFNTNLNIICNDWYEFNYDDLKCIQLQTVTPDIQKSNQNQDYFQFDADIKKDSYNIFTLTIPNESDPSQNAIPGVLSISDNNSSSVNNLKDSNLAIYLTTTCDDSCKLTTYGKSDSNCNNLFKIQTSSIYQAFLQSSNTNCQIIVKIDLAKESLIDMNFQISFLPLIFNDISGAYSTQASPLTVFWKNPDYAYLIQNIRINNPIVDQTNVDYILVSLTTTYSNTLSSFEYGTNVASSQCYRKFPASSAECTVKPTTVGDTSTYQFQISKNSNNIYAFFKLTQNTLNNFAYNAKYTVNCISGFSFNYEFKKCLPIVKENLVSQHYSTLDLQYFQKSITAQKGFSNIYVIQAQSEFALKSSIPGILYITDTTDDNSNNLLDSNVKIYMTSSCDSKCNQNTNDASYYQTCDSTFSKQSSIFSATQDNANGNCQIFIKIDISSSSNKNYNFTISQIPIIPLTNQNIKKKDPYLVDIFWGGNQFGLRIFEIDAQINTTESSSMISQISTYVSNIPTDSIQSFTYGTDNVQDQCNMMFPNENACVPSKTLDSGNTYTYKITSHLVTKKIYIFLKLKKSPQASFYINYNIDCITYFQFEYILDRCLLIQGDINSKANYQGTGKLYFEEYIITQKAKINTFTINIQNQILPQNNSLPGMLYITDNEQNQINDLKDSNLQVNLVTTCNDACILQDKSIISNTNNCNDLFKTKESSIFVSEQPKEATTCQITISFNQTNASYDKTLLISLLPLQESDISHPTTSISYELANLWRSNNAGQIYYELTFVNNALDTTNLKQLLTKLTNVESTYIAELYFGTDNEADGCKTKFPDSTSCIPTRDEQKNYILKTSTQTKYIYLSMKVNGSTPTHTTYFSSSVEYICKDNYLFDYQNDVRKCLPISNTNIEKAIYTTPYQINYYQQNIVAKKGFSNTYTLKISKQINESQSVLPGVLYISDNNINEVNNLNNGQNQIFIVSSCNKQCLINSQIASDDNKCQIFSQKSNSVYTSYQNNPNSDCQIQITIQVSDLTAAKDLNLVLSLLPIFNIQNQYSAPTTPFKLSTFWKENTIRIVKLDFTKIIQDYEKISKVITYLTGINTNSINGLTYGTDNDSDNCKFDFPDSLACTTSPHLATSTTYSYDIATNRDTQFVSLFFNIKNSIDFSYHYEIECITGYEYNYELQQCVKASGAFISQFNSTFVSSSISQIGYQDFIYAKKGQINTFTLEVAQQLNEQEGTIPGILYITDNLKNSINNLNSENLKIYMTTSCNSACQKDDSYSSLTNNCNELFTTQLNSVYTADQTLSNQFCRISLNFDLTSIYAVDQFYKISLIPKLLISIPHLTSEIPIYPNIFWKTSDFGKIIYELSLDAQLASLNNIVNLKISITGTSNSINALYFGTNNPFDKCEYIFPNEHQTCKVVVNDQNDISSSIKYTLTANKDTKIVYVSTEMTNISPQLFLEYQVICQTGYQYDANSRQCLVKKCNSGTYISFDTGVCESCPINCKECSTSTLCSSCIEGYILTTDKACEQFGYLFSLSLNLIIFALLFIIL